MAARLGEESNYAGSGNCGANTSSGRRKLMATCKGGGWHRSFMVMGLAERRQRGKEDFGGWQTPRSLASFEWLMRDTHSWVSQIDHFSDWTVSRPEARWPRSLKGRVPGRGDLRQDARGARGPEAPRHVFADETSLPGVLRSLTCDSRIVAGADGGEKWVSAILARCGRHDAGRGGRDAPPYPRPHGSKESGVTDREPGFAEIPVSSQSQRRTKATANDE